MLSKTFWVFLNWYKSIPLTLWLVRTIEETITIIVEIQFLRTNWCEFSFRSGRKTIFKAQLSRNMFSNSCLHYWCTRINQWEILLSRFMNKSIVVVFDPLFSQFFEVLITLAASKKFSSAAGCILLFWPQKFSSHPLTVFYFYRWLFARIIYPFFCAFRYL